MSIEIMILDVLFTPVLKIYSATDTYDTGNVMLPASDKCMTTKKNLEIMTYKYLESKIHFFTVYKKKKDEYSSVGLYIP